MPAQDLTPKIQDHITREIDAVNRFRSALNDLLELHGEYQDNGFSGVISQDHIAGDIIHMTPDLVANVYTSILAIDAFMEAGFHDDVLAQASR